ncbi:hypothetical protein LCGC14_0521230 [marine sediment metagenome]|uniref:Uncharacterized protein n=1 Tax=marine sediment metagenome TaxID=412755 RepID=A0A0F9RYK3_9ZZZZ
MPEQTNEKRAALLEMLAGCASITEGSKGMPDLAKQLKPIIREQAVKAILLYFNDPEITMAYNEVKDRTD